MTTNTPVDSVLASRHDRFLGFVQARVRSRDAAEDILQSAYVKAAEKGGELRDDESAVAWFYRILRNAIIDHYRRPSAAPGGAPTADLDAAAEEAVEPEALRATACACVRDLVSTLKPEWASLVERVDLEGVPVVEVAKEQGITANNASVRLHRARRELGDGLRRVCGACSRHGCLDCSCGKGPGHARTEA